jgi:hypothetical protein
LVASFFASKLAAAYEGAVSCADLSMLEHPPIARRPALWDGRAAERIADALLEA